MAPPEPDHTQLGQALLQRQRANRIISGKPSVAEYSGWRGMNRMRLSMPAPLPGTIHGLAYHVRIRDVITVRQTRSERILDEDYRLDSRWLYSR